VAKKKYHLASLTSVIIIDDPCHSYIRGLLLSCNNQLKSKIFFMNNTGRILTAFAAGVVAGAISGILFAPDKGNRTRRKLNRQGKRIAFEMQDKIREGKGKLNDLKEDIAQTMK